LAKFEFKTTKERSELMSKIRGVNIKPELELRKAIWKLGFRYRLNVSKLKGKPDIVFNKYKVVVFVDGEFWHGISGQKRNQK
jgi:DNA mismatch endonuclease, patch repair protein